MYIASGSLNQEIKKAMKEHKVKQWQIAEKLGMSEFTLSRWMRHELDDEKKKIFLEAITEIKEERANE